MAFHRQPPNAKLASTAMKSGTSDSGHSSIKLLDLRPLILLLDFSEGTSSEISTAPLLLSEIADDPITSRNSLRQQATSHIRSFLGESVSKRGIRMAEPLPVYPLESTEKTKRKQSRNTYQVKSAHEIGKFMLSAQVWNVATNESQVVLLARAENHRSLVPGDMVCLHGSSSKYAFSEEIALYGKWSFVLSEGGDS